MASMLTCPRCGARVKNLGRHYNNLTAAQYAKHGGTMKKVGKRVVRNKPTSKLGRPR